MPVFSKQQILHKLHMCKHLAWKNKPKDSNQIILEDYSDKTVRMSTETTLN